MGPVMANCVRRSNALLGYSGSLTFADYMLRGHPTWREYLGLKSFEALVGAAVMAPSVFARWSSRGVRMSVQTTRSPVRSSWPMMSSNTLLPLALK